MRIVFLRKKIILKTGAVFYLIYLELTFFLLPFFLRNPPGELSYLAGHQLLAPVLSLGFVLLSFCYMFFLIMPKGIPNFSVQRFNYKRVNIPLFMPIMIVLVMFASSLISDYLGIMTMGEESAIVLPFKLVGLLNILRIYLFPYLCFFLITYFYEKKEFKHLIILIFLFIAWTLLESYLRVSRGVFIRSFLPIFLYFIFSKLIDIKRGILISLIVAPVFILIFLGGDTIRQLNFLKRDITIENIIERTQYIIKLNPREFYLYQRLFPTGIEISKYLHYERSFFHFEIDRFMEYTGNANFHTRVLDNVDQSGAGRFHSSGIGGISDGFYLAGTLGFLMSGSFFLFLFFMVDYGIADFALKSMSIVFILDLLFGGIGLLSYVFFGTLLLRLVFPTCLCFHAFCIWKSNHTGQRG